MYIPPKKRSIQPKRTPIQKKHLMVVFYSFIITLCLLMFLHKLHNYQMGMINAHSDFIDKGCHRQPVELQKTCWDEIVQGRKERSYTSSFQEK